MSTKAKSFAVLASQWAAAELARLAILDLSFTALGPRPEVDQGW
jgi:hypothetical protein